MAEERECGVLSGIVLARCLEAQGVQRAFCVPGESFLPVLDALRDSSIQVVACRQESGAAMMAEATGKLTGEAGVCFVSRGPGATNASAAVHIAAQDSTPLILFIGQVERGFREREAFQEIDYSHFFGKIAKWAVEINDAARIPELVSRAFYVAKSGRPGPVVVSLPEDILVEPICPTIVAKHQTIETYPGAAEMAELASRLAEAQSPIAILGGSRWSAAAIKDFTGFAEAFSLPVATSFRRSMLFDALHPNYAGEVGVGLSPALKARIEASDLVLLVGARMGELPSQSYTLLSLPQPKQQFVHVHVGAEELGRVYAPTLAIHASPIAFSSAAAKLSPSSLSPTRSAWCKSAHEDYLAWSEVPPPGRGAVELGSIMQWLRENLGADTILTTGAGNYAGWVQRFYRFRAYGTQIAPTSGTMGYGLPAAIASKLVASERDVVCFAGDGCFLMTGQEFATAVHLNLPIVIIIVNNGMYGTIRMHQEREYPGRVVATDLTNPDFAAYARAFGGHGETVSRTEEFASAFRRAKDSGKPSIIEIRVDPEVISVGNTISGLRQQAKARHGVR